MIETSFLVDEAIFLLFLQQEELLINKFVDDVRTTLCVSRFDGRQKALLWRRTDSYRLTWSWNVPV